MNALFLPAPGGQRFGLFHPAQGTGTPRGAVLYIHPFAEEMNKSRRMAALQARALAQAGFDVLQIDLLGCGDSSGDFGDATWAAWVDDVLLGVQWLRQRSAAPLWLWGLRAGCLLAVDAARQLAEPCHFLFWQPPSSGKLLLQQFMRLKAAGEIMGGQAKGILQALRDQLARGQAVEIAGYQLAPALASGLEQASLMPPAQTTQQPAVPVPHEPDVPPVSATAASRVVWLEMTTRPDASFSPVATQGMAQWQQAGYALAAQLVQGPSFWQTTEIEEAPALIEATTAAVMDAGSRPA